MHVIVRRSEAAVGAGETWRDGGRFFFDAIDGDGHGGCFRQCADIRMKIGCCEVKDLVVGPLHGAVRADDDLRRTLFDFFGRSALAVACVGRPAFNRETGGLAGALAVGVGVGAGCGEAPAVTGGGAAGEQARRVARGRPATTSRKDFIAGDYTGSRRRIIVAATASATARTRGICRASSCWTRKISRA